MQYITLPEIKEILGGLRAGDRVLLSGKAYTARDAAHKRLCEAIAAGKPLPIELAGAAIYYAGPCPAKPGEPIGSCGPTTSSRMDALTPPLLERGLAAMIGKGKRSREVVDLLPVFGAVYFAAVGGAGALYADCVTSCRLVAYPDLLSEAIYELTLRDFPVLVAADTVGGCIY